MAKILCADTSSQLCSVSIFNNDDLVDSINSNIERSHSKILLKQIDDLLNKINRLEKAAEDDAEEIDKLVRELEKVLETDND